MTSNCVVIESIARHKDVPTHPVMAQIFAPVLSRYTAMTGPKMICLLLSVNNITSLQRHRHATMLESY